MNADNKLMFACETGCQPFMCGSIGHHKDCMNYPLSQAQQVDDKNNKIEEQAAEIELLKKLLKAEKEKRA